MAITMKHDEENAAAMEAEAAAATPIDAAIPATADKSNPTAGAAAVPSASSAEPPSLEDLNISEGNTTAATYATSQSDVPTQQQRPKGVSTRLAITDRAEEEARMEAAGVTEEEKSLREKMATKA